MNKIHPTNNLAFQKIFASTENTDITAGLTDDFFFFMPDDIQISSPYNIDLVRTALQSGEINKFRLTISDIAYTCRRADIISDMQLLRLKYFHERFAYYAFRRFCNNYATENNDAKSSYYGSLKPVYALNFLVEPHFPDDDALRVFELYDPKRNKSYGKELIHIAFFELTKPNIETVNQRHWRDFFMTGEANPNAPQYIKKAAGVIEYANLQEEERLMFEAIEKAEADYNAVMEYAHDEGIQQGIRQGIQQGIQQGMLEGIITTARNMRDAGMSAETIRKITGLSVMEIERL